MIEPLRDNLLVESITNTTLKITLPDRSASDYHFGVICFIGPDVKQLRVGDIIVMPTWNEDKLTADGAEYIILTEKSISVRII